MLPHLRVHFKAHADDHILPQLLVVWTIPFPRLSFAKQNFGGDQRIMMGLPSHQ